MPTERARPKRSAQSAGLALLASREHSREELARKLATRGYEAAEIATALAALAEDHYLNDERAAQAKLRSGVRRGHGPVRIRADLREAGLGTEVLKVAAEDASVDWVAQAREVLSRKYGDDPPADYAQWARRARFLQSRGYAVETIRHALARDPLSETDPEI